jgi:nitroimidazol reductase NimA-like FMN-containing flavoprotein (pyridoxamine 5'-phosphate oxidase superfamily)
MHIYCFTTSGRKVEWMRDNPAVCVEIDDIVHNRQWETVIAFGQYEEIHESPGRETAVEHAWSLLQGRPNWWEPGYVRTVVGSSERPLEPIFFRITLGEMTGHRTAADISVPQAKSGAK